MSCSSSLLVTCALVLVISHCIVSASDNVPFTPVSNAIQRRAVCIDGSPGGYHYAPGSGDGAKNWLVYLMGGGWCPTNSDCEYKRTMNFGSSRYASSANLTGMLSDRQHINPDFYNWNRIYVKYCDQSSFLGDTEIVDRGPNNLQFRGSRIFDAVIEDLMEKGMKDADNAMLAGRSAGGLGAIHHCDGFRARLPNVARVKCFSDSGFFIRAKDVPGADFRYQFFASVVAFHNISSILPTSCTKRMDPSLCFLPEYIVGDIQTPLFLLNSAFDFVQIFSEFATDDSSEIRRMCTNGDHCTPTQKQQIQDFGKSFLKTIMEIPDNPSRGIFINTCYDHVFTSYPVDQLWTPHSTLRLGNNMENMLEAVGNWYFDRSSVNLIDNTNDFPQNCSKYI